MKELRRHKPPLSKRNTVKIKTSVNNKNFQVEHNIDNSPHGT